ncbi:PqqD family protein [Nocardioides sp. GXQ0305]|uniref:PqqD family protein n=1 Tax=Nocardioides sp. GXQ0305 TaxID=3423912 RepID=UPI003D7EB28E
MSETRWRRSPDATSVDSGDQVVVLDLSSSDPRPQVLEGVAAVIWRLLEEPRSEESVVSALLDTYADAEAEQVRQDVPAFLAQLADAGLATTE